MFDGKRSLDDVLKATAGLGVTADDVEQMQALGLLEPVISAPYAASAGPMSPTPSSASAPPVSAPLSAVPAGSQGDTPTLDAQAHFLKAWPIATRLTANLGLRGFRLNLAVESAGDLAKLKELAPRIKDAVGADKFRELEIALYQ
jgi:hypothetical protein